jgi:hypothetical protein
VYVSVTIAYFNFNLATVSLLISIPKLSVLKIAFPMSYVFCSSLFQSHHSRDEISIV